MPREIRLPHADGTAPSGAVDFGGHRATDAAPF